MRDGSTTGTRVWKRTIFTCGIGGIDEAGDDRADRNGITLGDRGNRGFIAAVDETCLNELSRSLDRAMYVHGCVSATGAQSTWSIRDAPVASITSRSKPSAMPLASGMIASAARKSSSSG